MWMVYCLLPMAILHKCYVYFRQSFNINVKKIDFYLNFNAIVLETNENLQKLHINRIYNVTNIILGIQRWKF